MAGGAWSEAETTRALYLYFQLPFGQLDRRNPEIIALAGALGRSSSSIAMKLANFASLDPKIRESGRAGLAGTSARDRQIWAHFENDWTGLVMEAEALADEPPNGSSTLKEAATPDAFDHFTGPSTTTAMVVQRKGQDFFRRAVLANYESRCCVTGITEIRLLNASHIMPWKTDEKNRHNPRNGLCLSATFDRAFDRGLMAVDEVGRARFSKLLLNSPSSETRMYFEPYEGRTLLPATRFDPDVEFLRIHRTTLFDRVHANG
ncbi:HNH endonuclease [Sphingomonas sp. AR_OL41]|uniref:HNH endonuclease n=1 Tax=Sphingomonas sp. AR_OL41 TaxID=3042729 RepID=UPI0024809164|nr:HNH endonuclease [Sphingomonas sp. AR_OL41]MDH7974162.1 HNH endonuclease [Sphingomonas sp. AR_OL41]